MREQMGYQRDTERAKRQMLQVLTAVLSCLLIFLTGFLWPAPAWAAEGNQRVFDDAGLLTESEKESLEAQVTKMRDSMKMDVVLVTTADTGGRSARQYADDFYDAGGFGTRSDHSGVLFLIDMDNREIYVSTSGTMIRFLTDDRVEMMLDHAYTDVADEDYMGAMRQLLTDTGEYFQKGIPGGQYNYDTETGAISVHRSIRWYEALLAFAVAAFCGGGACLNVKREYAMKQERGRAAGFNLAYRANANFTFQDQKDVLVNSFVTQRMLPRHTGGGRGGGMGGGFGGGAGRSSTHTSSAGRTHGGGGRKF